jgi:hypothetical protein
MFEGSSKARFGGNSRKRNDDNDDYAMELIGLWE